MGLAGGNSNCLNLRHNKCSGSIESGKQCCSLTCIRVRKFFCVSTRRQPLLGAPQAYRLVRREDLRAVDMLMQPGTTADATQLGVRVGVNGRGGWWFSGDWGKACALGSGELTLPCQRNTSRTGFAGDPFAGLSQGSSGVVSMLLHPQARLACAAIDDCHEPDTLLDLNR
jgi:hypothetical protein